MASFPHSQQCSLPKPNKNEDAKKEDREEDCTYNEIISTLPTARGWKTEHLIQYQGTWLTNAASIKVAMQFQQHFKALPTDIILATFPKSGTTWFKSLIFSITNRARFEISTHPLLTTGPHDCIPMIEELIYLNPLFSTQNLLPSPRLFSTHMPYSFFPESVTKSGCRIVYIWRNPKDVLVSMWHFFSKQRPKELGTFPLGEAYELFCQGIADNGPSWDHVLGFWKASLQSPATVLFLSYENMKMEPIATVKRLAEFLGLPFSSEEERDGAVEEIIRLCSFKSLTNLEVNKTGVKVFNEEGGSIENKDFFRKGEIGDWENHLTTEMVERLDRITEEKFEGFGLTSHVPPPLY